MSIRESGTRETLRHWLPAFSGRLRRGIVALALGALVGYGGTAQAQVVSGTVEQGLAELAQRIAEGSKDSGNTTIAVLRFPHADGACSVLSTYVVDELILALFSQPNSQLEIIERSQLEAVIAELNIGMGGLLNPATTRELGNISGVGALAIGTVTVIGDLVRLNARLVATDTGRTIAAAAVTVPRTPAVNALLEQPAPCSNVETVAAVPGGNPPTPSQPATPGNVRDRFQSSSVSVVPATAYHTGYALTLAVTIENHSGMGIGIAALSNSSSLGGCPAQTLTGLEIYDRDDVPSLNERHDPQDFAYLPQDGRVVVSEAFQIFNCTAPAKSDFTLSLIILAEDEVFVLPVSAAGVSVQR